MLPFGLSLNLADEHIIISSLHSLFIFITHISQIFGWHFPFLWKALKLHLVTEGQGFYLLISTPEAKPHPLILLF